MMTSKRILAVIAFAFCYLISPCSFGQVGPSGEENVEAGTTHQYTYTDDQIFGDPNWDVSLGHVVNSGHFSATYWVDISFDQGVGTCAISFRNGTATLGTLYVQVSASPPPTPSTTFTTTYNCGNTVVTRNSSPASGIDWYWQTSSSGTSTTNSTSSYTINSTGSLWLRSRLTVSPYTWSTSSLAVGSVTVYTAAPATPTVSNGSSRFNAGALTLSVGAVSNALSYPWYTQSSGGTAISGQTSNTYNISNLSATTTYYVSSKNGCESSGRLAVTGTILSPPVVVSTGSNGAVITMGQPAQLATTTSYTSYDWRNSANQSVGTNPTLSMTTPGTYTVIVTQAGAINSGVSLSFRVFSEVTGFNGNYIITNTVQVKDVTDPNAIIGLTATQKTQTIQYFDGLGRPSQTISTQGSPLQKDMVQTFVYDEFAREANKYLPYASTETNGWPKTNPLTAQASFYQTASKVATDADPYEVTVFDNSPLNRVVEQGSPGTAWQSRKISKAYELNDAGEVRLWTYTAPDVTYPLGLVNAGTVGAPDHYGANQLTRNKTIDEEQHVVIEYVDKLGRTVLKRVQAVNVTPVDDTNYASTYYVYDDFGNLVSVIPPQATKLLVAEYLGAADGAKNSFLDRWAFRYRYDEKRRMIQKKLPGADVVYMVYDQRDRVVFTQDGNQRPNKQWTYTKYDQLNRPIISGIYTHGTVIDQYNMSLLISTSLFSETYNGQSSTEGYTNTVFPTSGTVPLTVTYYDNYSFRSLWSGSWTYINEPLSEIVNGVTYSQQSPENTLVAAQVTGSKVRVLDGGATLYTWLRTANYYDDNYRVAQTIAENYKAGQDRTTNVLDFLGRPVKNRITHVEQDVTWKDISNVSFAGNKISRIASTGGAASVQMLGSGIDGWIEVTVAETNANRFFGFNDSNPDVNFASMEYCLYLNGTVLKIYESNVLKTYTGSQTIATGDVLRIERTGSTIKYFRNGLQLSYQNNSAVSSALLADISLTSAGATLLNLRTSFSTTTQTVTRRFNYDHAGRLYRVYHKLNTDSVLLVQNEYNELGQLVDKKLHSTDNGTTFKQSVDQRYNIRGWLTSINNSKLEVNSSNNDETNDLFGMELKYDQVDGGLGNSPLYNGNISGIKWSNFPTPASLQEKGYTFTYDPMNRILGSTFKEKAASWASLGSSGNAETGFSYDLNGNIQTLTRNDKRASGTMDILTYTYGTAGATGNKLMKVDDAGDDYSGFLDGTNSGDDYSYDNNGNMNTDANKSLTTAIAYNFLNLPELVTRGGNTVRYIYDATGRKLNQTLTLGTINKQTDYVGEFQYESDVLQLVSHDEGRVVTGGTTVVYTHNGEVTTGLSPSASTLAAVTLNGQKYVRVTANTAGANRGILTIGSSIAVTAGERYRIRIKGYTTGANLAYINVKINGTSTSWPGSQLPAGVQAEAWTEQDVLIPSGITTLGYGLLWYPTVAAGEIMYVNEIEINRLSTTAAEYQYFLKDHLGSVRLTFTAKTITTTSYSTDLEAGSNSNFQNYTNTTFDLVDHTDAGTTYSKVQWLNGGVNGRTGLAKSFSVMPGDEISISAYCKYMNLTTNNNTNAFITSLAAAFGVSSSSTGEALKIYNGLNAYTGTVVGGDHPNDDEAAPKLFATIVFFDRDYNLVDAAWDQVTTTGLQSSPSTKEPPHDLLSKTAKAPVAGYAFVFLSNEHPKFVDAYFDDVTFSVMPSMVVHSEDYYPFGLSMNSYDRENTTAQNYKYIAKELQDELTLGWLDYGARMYDPAIARWMTTDPLSEVSRRWSPYNYVLNNPLRFIDPDGMIWKDPKEAEKLKQSIEKRQGEVNKQRDKILAKLDGKKELSEGKRERLSNRLAKLDSRMSGLEVAKADIGILGDDPDHTYDLVNTSGETHGVRKGEDGVINIEGSNNALHIHEVHHTALSVNSESGLQFNSSGQLRPALSADGLSDEIDAYKVQYSFSPTSIPNSPASISGIDFTYLGGLKDSNNNAIYPALYERWQNRQMGLRKAKKQERKNRKE